MDANKTAGEETGWQLHKNAACNPEQVLAATPYKTPTYGHLPPITKTIQVRRTRHAGHCWRSRDQLIRDVLLWIPTHGRAKAGRPARTYIQQLCEDTGCCPEDLPRAMNDREEWRERVRDIRATSAIWWWWWYACLIWWVCARPNAVYIREFSISVIELLYNMIVNKYVSFYIAWKLICDHRFHALFIPHLSGGKWIL